MCTHSRINCHCHKQLSISSVNSNREQQQQPTKQKYYQNGRKSIEYSRKHSNNNILLHNFKYLSVKHFIYAQRIYINISDINIKQIETTAKFECQIF